MRGGDDDDQDHRDGWQVEGHLALLQLYSVPVLTTAWVPRSPHSTTSRLLTIAALRSSSSSTTPRRLSWSSAISTMLTAPSTIFVRAAMIAPACWRCSIAWAISCA